MVVIIPFALILWIKILSGRLIHDVGYNYNLFSLLCSILLYQYTTFFFILPNTFFHFSCLMLPELLAYED